MFQTVEQIIDSIDTYTLPMFDRADFLLYCNFMMFDVGRPPTVIQPYYWTLYKQIEMFYEEQFEKDYFIENLAT